MPQYDADSAAPLNVFLQVGASQLLVCPDVGGSIAEYSYHEKPIFRVTSPEAIRSQGAVAAACYPLVPYSNRIAYGRFRHRGTAYELPRNFGTHPHSIHGLGWQRPWTLALQGTDRLRLTLRHDPHIAPQKVGESAWPFAFETSMTLTLGPNSLRCTLQMINHHRSAAPAGLGWHPFFARNDKTELQFKADSVSLTDETQLPVCSIPIPAIWNYIIQRPIGEPALDNCFDGWERQAKLFWPEHNLMIRIEASASCKFLVVYAPPREPFIALEPVTHLPNAFNCSPSGQTEEAYAGTCILQPGETLSCTMHISVLDR